MEWIAGLNGLRRIIFKGSIHIIEQDCCVKMLDISE